jgi:hypothetical protein
VGSALSSPLISMPPLPWLSIVNRSPRAVNRRLRTSATFLPSTVIS